MASINTRISTQQGPDACAYRPAELTASAAPTASRIVTTTPMSGLAINATIVAYTPELAAMLAKLKHHENLGWTFVVKRRDELIFAEVTGFYPLRFFFDFPDCLTVDALDAISNGISAGVDWLHGLGLHCGYLDADSVLVKRDFTPLLSKYCREVPTCLEEAQTADLEAMEALLDELASIRAMAAGAEAWLKAALDKDAEVTENIADQSTQHPSDQSDTSLVYDKAFILQESEGDETITQVENVESSSAYDTTAESTRSLGAQTAEPLEDFESSSVYDTTTESMRARQAEHRAQAAVNKFESSSVYDITGEAAMHLPDLNNPKWASPMRRISSEQVLKGHELEEHVLEDQTSNTD